MAPKTLIVIQYTTREDDPDRDAVERAAAARRHRERHGDERHDQRDERERQLAVQRHGLRDHVEAAGVQVADVVAKLQVRHPVRVG